MLNATRLPSIADRLSVWRKRPVNCCESSNLVHVHGLHNGQIWCIGLFASKEMASRFAAQKLDSCLVERASLWQHDGVTVTDEPPQTDVTDLDSSEPIPVRLPRPEWQKNILFAGLVILGMALFTWMES